MVDESLILYLQNKLATATTDNVNERLRHLIAYNDQPHRFSSTEVNSLINTIDNVKILDPACGSGAFPMGILHKLVFILAKLDPRNEKWQRRQIDRVKEAIKAAEQIEDSTFRERTINELEQQIADITDAFERNELDYGRKLYLIENCIYGVDIQPIACQIAKLRFFISLVVDQKIEDQRTNRGIRPLPNLETKFVAANTLLSVKKPLQLVLRNEEIDKKEKDLAEVRRRHFTAATLASKRKCRDLDSKIRQEIAALLQKDGFPRETTEKLARWDPYDQNAYADFFDPEWMFGIIAESKKQPSMSTLRGSLSIINQAGGQGELTPIDEFEEGFDIIIGNPPYVRQEEIKEFKAAFKELYDCFTGVADLYVYFYERSIKLLKTGGVLTFISSNKFFRAGYGEKLRAFLSQKTSLQQVIDFGDAPVFTAISYPSIVILTRQQPNGNQPRVMTWQAGPPIEEFASVFQANGFAMNQKELSSDGWRLESPVVLRLLEKLRKAGTPLGEYVKGRFYYGIKTGLNEAFVVDRATRDRLIAEDKSSAEILKPFLRGRDVKRWRVEPQDLWLIFTRHGTDLRKYPTISEHLKSLKKQLMPRPSDWDEKKRGKWPGRKPGSYEWYEIQDNIAYWREFERPKIIIPAIEQTVAYAPDFGGHYGNDKTSICVTDQVSFLLGLLNSSLLWLFIRKIAAARQGGFFEFKPMYVTQLPIPPAEETQRALVTDLVDTILAAKRADPDADVSSLEAEIDQLVYSLYGLTREEVAIIEESLQERVASREVAPDSALEQQT
jgi:tRNA1(Val) A37 N6-methylase TrmN6